MLADGPRSHASCHHLVCLLRQAVPLSPFCHAASRLADKPVLLAKPITFMNNSGEAVGKLMRYYKAGGSHAQLKRLHMSL